MVEWIEFNVCIRERINDCRFQLAMTGELYEQVMKSDPCNVQRRHDILLLEQSIVEEMTRMIGLMVKYHTVDETEPYLSMTGLLLQLN